MIADSPPTQNAAPDADDRSRWIALIVLCVGMLMIVLDVTVVNVALPSIQEDLGFSQSSLAWVVNAYLIAFGGLLLLAGRLGDLISRRGVFLAGLAIFTLASIACGMAQSQEVLVAARFVQGIGGAMTSAVILGMIVTMFPEPREQAKAIGVYGFVASAGGSIGLLVGGVLTQSINWHWIFFVNIPIGIVTAVLAMRLLEKDKGIGFGNGADVLGAVLVTSALMLLVYTIVDPAAELGWGAGRTLVLFAVSLALLVAFLVREATASNPLIPLRLFRSRNISGANLIQVVSVAGMFSMFFMGSLYMQRVLGYDALQIGLAFLPGTIIMGILSLGYSHRLVMRYGARTVMVPAFALIAAGLVLFTQAPVDGGYVTHVLPTMVLFGIGGGLGFPALMTIAMSDVAPQDAGLASGLVNTTAQVGGALGLALLATLATTRTGDLTASGDSLAAALTGGYHLAFAIAALLMVVAILIAVFVLQSDRAGAGEAATQRLREVVENYMDAMARGDVEAVVAMLAKDAAWSMPPMATWYLGHDALRLFLAQGPLSGAWRWRHVPGRANGQPAIGAYTWRDDEGCYRPFALDVLTLSADGSQIEQVTSFIARSGEALTPEELARFPDEAVDAAKVGSIFTHCGLPERLA